MRGTITGVYAVVVLVVAVLSFGLMRAAIGDVSNRGEAQRAVTAAVAQLQVEGLRAERWLSAEANRETAREPFKAGAANARSEQATTVANGIDQRARESTVFAGSPPAVILFVDPKGVVLGRNGATHMRGDELGARHQEMVKDLQAGNAGSQIWVDKKHAEQWLASYAPIRDGGEVIGGLVVGTALSDERLQEISNSTSSSGLALLVESESVEAIAHTKELDGDILATAVSNATPNIAKSDGVAPIGGLPEDYEGSISSIDGFGGNKAAIIAVSQIQSVGGFSSLVLPFLGVLVLGLILTAVCAHLIDAYISQPISDLEDGLLAVINGQTDLRFELDHKLLGGLVFRVNSLLNQLLGVDEDDTDDEGRPSVAPSSNAFTAALNVDERMVSLSLDDVEDAHSLRDEAPEDYYKRLYDEYIAAKRAVGDPVDHVRFAQFERRVKGLERDMTDKHGKPFRYRVEQKGGDVMFVAVPLA